uniref:Uncharacterized protein n=1 Tax=Hyaloperonospora arabidopsidis (strain Emoy2) TaxID=559515 RepID=M4BWY5_HYAAE
MGDITANTYQCPIHYFTCVGASMTFFPLTCEVEANKLPICFAFKNGNHFVALEMDENFPAPPVVAYWRRLAYPMAQLWAGSVQENLRLWMVTKHAPTITTVDLVGEEDGSGSEEEEEDIDLVTLSTKET